MRALAQLPRNKRYNYINIATKGLIEIVDVVLPEGPIVIKRHSQKNQEKKIINKPVSISTSMLARVVNAIKINQPINLDRVLGASYNTRSVLESLIAHTTEFYYCYPGRIDIANKHKVAKGHKHLIWLPDIPHKLGVMCETETEVIISEVPSKDIYYDALVLPEDLENPIMDIEVKRRHAQIQIALIEIGKNLGFNSWIAQNDKGILYKDKRISEFDYVLDSLEDQPLISPHNGATKAALLIDCIWFKDTKMMPAVMEVEHSTGVTSGLTRMKNFYDRIPRYQDTNFIIVAADEDREKVFREANKPQFEELKTKFFPYSAVEELYSLCLRRELIGITEKFVESFMEDIILST